MNQFLLPSFPTNTLLQLPLQLALTSFMIFKFILLGVTTWLALPSSLPVCRASSGLGFVSHCPWSLGSCGTCGEHICAGTLAASVNEKVLLGADMRTSNWNEEPTVCQTPYYEWIKYAIHVSWITPHSITFKTTPFSPPLISQCFLYVPGILCPTLVLSHIQELSNGANFQPCSGILLWKMLNSRRLRFLMMTF